MIREEEWDRLYYAVVKKFDRGGKVQILGIGSSKLMARTRAMEYLSEFVTGMGYNSIIEAISTADIDTFIRPLGESNGMISIMYCEAKVQIYGRRYGIDGMLCVVDPTYKDNLLRFAGYDDKETRRLENGRQRARRKRGI